MVISFLLIYIVPISKEREGIIQHKRWYYLSIAESSVRADDIKCEIQMKGWE
jgi:hypothetical protein